jgi:hypothetical protein
MLASRFLPTYSTTQISDLPPRPSPASDNMTSSDDEDCPSEGENSTPSDKESLQSPAPTPPTAVRKKFSQKTAPAFPPAQEAYLLTFVPNYLEICSSIQGRGPRGLAGAKGKKGAYILNTIIPAFMTEFKTQLEGRDKKEVEIVSISSSATSLAMLC